MECCCNLCMARKLNCSSLEIYFGRDSVEAKYVRKYPTEKVYFYEYAAKLEKSMGREPTREEVIAYIKGDIYGC